MSEIPGRDSYKANLNLFGNKAIHGDFSPFYITIAICTVIGLFIILLNVICACCSKYKYYWQDRHTGNRWIVSIWSATPHKQPPLDFTELKTAEDLGLYKKHYIQEIETGSTEPIHLSHHQQQQSSPVQQSHRPTRPGRFHHHHQREREEYVELQQKKESDI